MAPNGSLGPHWALAAPMVAARGDDRAARAVGEAAGRLFGLRREQGLLFWLRREFPATIFGFPDVFP